MTQAVKKMVWFNEKEFLFIFKAFDLENPTLDFQSWTDYLRTLDVMHHTPTVCVTVN